MIVSFNICGSGLIRLSGDRMTNDSARAVVLGNEYGRGAAGWSVRSRSASCERCGGSRELCMRSGCSLTVGREAPAKQQSEAKTVMQQ